MPRKIAPEPPAPRPELVVSLDEARAKIQDRIARGVEIRDRRFQSIEEIDAAESDYRKWTAFNTELLKTLFNVSSPAEEYARWYGGVVSMGAPSPHERIVDIKKDVGEKLHRLESLAERLELFPIARGVPQQRLPITVKAASGKRVFIVHGHDQEARETTARFLERLDLEAVILHEQATGGRTIVEKLEYYSDVDFAVILLTPDDLGAAKTSANTLQPRARQNVILELGYFVAKLGRAHVCALYRGPLELPTDYLGVGYIAIDDAGAWKFSLAKELKNAGFTIDMNRL